MNDPVTRDSKIMAPARCTREQASAYVFRHMQNVSNYTRVDLDKIIIPAYFTEGQLAGVDPCIAIAQMIHETGFLSSFWSKRPRRNPAGLGVTGQTAKALPKDASFWNGRTMTMHVFGRRVYGLMRGIQEVFPHIYLAYSAML